MVVAPACVGHAQRLEDMVLGEVGERLAADPRDDDGEQVVVAVAVEIMAAGREVQFLLARDDVQHVLIVGGAAVARPALDRGDRTPVAQAAGVVQQVADRDRGAVIGHFRHDLADVIVQRQLAGMGQHQGRGGGELLGVRSGLEDAVRGEGDAQFQAGHAIGAGGDRLAIARDGDGAAGGCLAVPARKQRVETGERRGISRGRAGRLRHGGSGQCRSHADERPRERGPNGRHIYFPLVRPKRSCRAAICFFRRRVRRKIRRRPSFLASPNRSRCHEPDTERGDGADLAINGKIRAFYLVFAFLLWMRIAI